MDVADYNIKYLFLSIREFDGGCFYVRLQNRDQRRIRSHFQKRPIKTDKLILVKEKQE